MTKAEIISIGSELTSGRNLDTNSAWLSRELAEHGIEVGWHTTIADDRAANLDCFSIASRRAALVISTGGLGPTLDDLTREVLAELAGVPLEYHEPSWRHIEGIFRNRNRPLPERNRVQAMFPKGSEVLFNARGTAPGIWMRLNGAMVAALPGPPREMIGMFHDEVAPRLAGSGLARGVLVQRRIHTFGEGESAIEEKLSDLTRRGHDPEVGITASDATITLRIFGKGPTRAEAQAQIAPIEAVIRERLGGLVYGADEEELEQATAEALEESHLSLATAEGVTGGLVAAMLDRARWKRRCYLGGIVAHGLPGEALAGLPETTRLEHGSRSAEAALAMARGARLAMGADLGLATAGIASPDEAGPEKEAGQAWVALAWQGGEACWPHHWFASPAEVRSRTAKKALNQLRLHLLERRA